MSLPLPSDLRWLRGAVAMAISLGFGTVAHTVAGGMLPSASVFVLLAGGLFLVAGAALGGPCAYWKLLALVASGQLLVHLVLSLAAGHGPDANAHHAVTDSGAGSHAVESAISHVGTDLSGARLLAIAAHLGAAGLLVMWLVAGERALWTLVALLGRHLVERLHALVVWGAVPREVVADLNLVSGDRRVDSVQQWSARNGPTGRRGPPRPCTSFSVSTP